MSGITIALLLAPLLVWAIVALVLTYYPVRSACSKEDARSLRSELRYLLDMHGDEWMDDERKARMERAVALLDDLEASQRTDRARSDMDSLLRRIDAAGRRRVAGRFGMAAMRLVWSRSVQRKKKPPFGG